MKWPKLNSLQTRLMVVSISTSVLALAGAGGLATWQLHQDLFMRTKQDHTRSVIQFHQDVETYQEHHSPDTAISRAVAKYSRSNRWLRVRDANGTLLAASPELALYEPLPFPVEYDPVFLQFRQHTFIRCGQPIELVDRSTVYLETLTDVTDSAAVYRSFLQMLTVSGMTVIGIVVVGGMIAIRRSLLPLGNMSQLSNMISTDNLPDARLMLEKPPTEVRDLAEAFNGMLNRLSQAWGAERQLLNTISHELRTPLAIVQGYIEGTLRRGQNLTEEQTANLGISLEEVHRIERLLKDLLDLARVEAGTVHLNLELIDLNEILYDLGSSAQHLGPHPIQVNVPPNAIIVKTDRDRLKQVLLNLITNAIRYSDPESPIVLRLEIRQGRAVIQVQDHGIGISAEQQARIFERFYRVSEARNRAQGGVGLGLAITKALVEMMRGTISVQSEVGKGSTFTVLLPIVRIGHST